MVGAVLTIAGYSINDTIVVYDRIRSGFREGRKGSEREIMNASINETLGRTMLTGGMTLVTVLALYIGGGPVLNDFALGDPDRRAGGDVFVGIYRLAHRVVVLRREQGRVAPGNRARQRCPRGQQSQRRRACRGRAGGAALKPFSFCR